MSDPVGARLPRWMGTIAAAAMAASAIVFNPLAAGASATVIAEFPIPTGASTPQGITAGSDGNLWFAESTGGTRIGQITPTGSITEFSVLTGASFWITSGPGGNLWTTEPGANAIGELSTAGAVVGEFPVPTQGSLPDQIAAGPDGNAWFTEYVANQIGMITPAGVITEFPIPSADSGPTAIVGGSDGNLWFTEQKANMIGRITLATDKIDEFGPVGSTPAGMAAGPDGNVWFTEFGGNQIGRITPAGVIAQFAVTGSAPASIAAGPDGNLWFTEYGSNQIGRMSTAGALLAEFGIPTGGSAPNGIATGPDGNLWFTESSVVNQIGRLTPGTAADPTALTYDGATTGDFNDPATVSATLADTTTAASTPLTGQSVVFTLNGAETCTGVTDASGHATCQLTPAETSGAYSVAVSFAGTATLNASSTSASFAVTVEEAALTLTAPAVVANGSPVTLNAILAGDAALPLAGRTVTLSLGTGAAAQTCAATTSAAGAATCTIAAVNQPLGSGGLNAGFAGDGFYTTASAGGASLVFAFVSGGIFVVGDGSPPLGGTVTFWSSAWLAANTLSGGAGSASFKGFATTVTPACGGLWTSTTGNSSNPPAGPLPAYMAVAVTSSVDKSGATVTGHITRIVIVKTDSGYSPDPGGTGTGTVVAVLCSA